MALKGGFSRWWRWTGAAQGLATALVIVIVVAAVSYAASVPKVRVRWDLTADQGFTLSDQTRQVLRSLEEPVRFISLMQPEPVSVTRLDEVQALAGEYVNTLLGQYALASGGQLTVETLHPHRDRLRTETLRGERHLSRYNLVLVEGVTRSKQVFLEDLVTIDRGRADAQSITNARIRAYHAEGPLTSALLSVADEVAPRVGFLSGFGGPRLDGFELFDLGLFFSAVAGQGLDVERIDMSSEVPGTALTGYDVVVLCGPDLPLSRGAREALAAFHAEGGGLLLAADPDYVSPEYDTLLRQLGLERDRAILCRDDDPFLVGLDRALVTIGNFDPTHVVTTPIAAQRTFARFFGSGALGRSPSADARVISTPLATTGTHVFGDLPSAAGARGDFVFTPGEGELRGARHVAFALERDASDASSRAVVLACASPLINSFLTSRDGGPANMDLGLNAVNWLVDRPEAVAARPREVFESKVDLMEGELETIHLYVLLLMPLGGVLMGLAVWFTRRR